MQIYNWYEIFNLSEFLSKGLVSRELTLNLVGVGLKTILITQGFSTCITFDETMLSLGLGKNPFAVDDYAVFLDSDSQVWLGIAE